MFRVVGVGVGVCVSAIRVGGRGTALRYAEFDHPSFLVALVAVVCVMTLARALGVLILGRTTNRAGHGHHGCVVRQRQLMGLRAQGL